MIKESRCQYPEVEFYNFELDKDGYFPNRYFDYKKSSIEGNVGLDGQENYPRFTYGEQAIRWAGE